MRYNNRQIILSKPEIRALLAFCGKREEAVVYLGLRPGRVVAYASDSALCVRATADADHKSASQDWVMLRESVAHVLRALKADHEARFQIGESGEIQAAQIWALDKDGTSERCGARTLPESVPAQTLLFEDLVEQFAEDGDHAACHADCAYLPGDCLRAVSSLCAAAGCQLLELRFPTAADQPLTVVAHGALTRWEALVIHPQDEGKTADDSPLFDRSRLAKGDECVPGEDVPEEEPPGPAAMSLDLPPPKPAVVQGPRRRGGRKGGK